MKRGYKFTGLMLVILFGIYVGNRKLFLGERMKHSSSLFWTSFNEFKQTQGESKSKSFANKSLNRQEEINRKYKVIENILQGKAASNKSKTNENPVNKGDDLKKLNATEDVYLVLKGPNTNNRSFDNVQTTWKKLLQNFVSNNETSQFDNHAMNAVLSRSLPLDRNIPETRSQECINKYSNVTNIATSSSARWKFRKVSIVIPFHNEEYSIFLRSLHSVYQQTPSWLIHEVILVDDNSTFQNLRKPFEEYVKHFPKLKLYRTHRREGLIRSRLLGAIISSGDVLVFLDAHIECQKNWLEPLLDMVNSKPGSVAIPTVDYINPKTLNYRLWSRPQYGTFSWELDFVWKDIEEIDLNSDATTPIKSATMIGCVSLITRETFLRIGSYDEHMYIWGGENMDLSFRAWLCGEGLYMAPCSHVGHLFRLYLPYHFPTGDMVINKNLQRVVDTWLGPYKQHYYATVTKQVQMSTSEKQSLETRRSEMNSLKCKPFQWYLENIAKGVDAPVRSSRLFGQLKSVKKMQCMFYSDNLANIIFRECTILHTNQTFYFNKTGHLVHYRSGKCIGLGVDNKISMLRCKPLTDSQIWSFDPVTAPSIRSSLYGVDTRRPIGLFKLKLGNYTVCLNSSNMQSPAYCSMDASQLWIFTHNVKQF